MFFQPSLLPKPASSSSSASNSNTITSTPVHVIEENNSRNSSSITRAGNGHAAYADSMLQELLEAGSSRNTNIPASASSPYYNLNDLEPTPIWEVPNRSASNNNVPGSSTHGRKITTTTSTSSSTFSTSPLQQQLPRSPSTTFATVSNPTTTSNGKPAGAGESFPVKLHHMLWEVELVTGKWHIVSWQPHGRCFLIHDAKAFMKYVIGRYFAMSKFESLQRQLNIYGFRRITAGPDKGAYYHELFLRQRPELARSIKRLRVKGTGPRKPACPELEPSFYAMVPMPMNSYPESEDKNPELSSLDMSDQHQRQSNSSIPTASNNDEQNQSSRFMGIVGMDPILQTNIVSQAAQVPNSREGINSQNNIIYQPQAIQAPPYIASSTETPVDPYLSLMMPLPYNHHHHHESESPMEPNHIDYTMMKRL